jgi:hypothetical protein
MSDTPYHVFFFQRVIMALLFSTHANLAPILDLTGGEQAVIPAIM